jgi:glycosyltransferase involved in cell wall biosynthesis
VLYSIVINNYNYERYLRQAIDSVLAQTYPSVQLIVVDDGSTDGSREIILSYGDRLVPVFKENGGQGSAYNAGFPEVRGEIVQFLDADDILEPDACEKVLAAFAEGVVKVHFPLSLVGPDLEPLGGSQPAIRMPDGDVRELVLKYGAYGSPPASGNAYRTSVVRQILPMPEKEWFIGADSYLLLQAPFFGEIRTISEELGMYRQHRPSGQQSEGDFHFGIGNASQLDRVVNMVPPRRTRLLEAVAKKHGLSVEPGMDENNPAVAKNWLCAVMLDMVPSTPGKRVQRSLVGAWKCLRFPLYPASTRFLGALWFLAAGFLPRRLAKPIIRQALDPSFRRINRMVTKSRKERNTTTSATR